MESSIESPKKEMYNIGLALSGGGAKGIAHIGVLKAMEEFNLKPQIISGVSAGAIIGAMYADGISPDDICFFFKQTKFFNYVSFKRQKMGIFSQYKFENMLSSVIKSTTFEDLKIPLVINATELVEGKNEYFSSGPLIEKVVASSSVPIFLTPKRIGNKVYVDGGIFNNMPCRVIRKRCRLLAGCHVNPIATDPSVDSALDVAARVYDLSIQSSTVPEKRSCDILFEPVEAKKFDIFDIDHTEEIFNIGYDYACKVLSQLTINFDKNEVSPILKMSDLDYIS